MVAIQQDGQPAVDNPTGGEAIWRLLTGVAHDSWDAICKHSPVHSSEHETDTTTAEADDAELKRRVGGGGGNNNRRGNNNNNGNHGNNGNNGNNNNDKTTSSTEAPAQTTPATSTTPVKEASTPAGAKTTSTTPEAEKSTPAAAADPTTKATSKEAAASPAATSTPAADNDKGEPTTTANNNDGNDSSGNQTSQDAGAGNNAAATAAPSGSSNNDSNNNNGNNSNAGAAASQTGATPTASAAADAPGATNTGSSNVNSVYVEPNGQTTTVHEQATPTSSGGGRALGAAATSDAASPTGSSASSSTGTGSTSTGGGSHAGVIAGVVVALALLLIAAALLYRFRRSKALRPLFAACGGNRNGGKGKNGVGGGKQGGAQRLNSRGSVRSLLTPIDALPSASLPSAGLSGGGPAMSEKMSPTHTGGVFNEKLYVMAMAAGAGAGAAAAGVHSMSNLPAPAYPPATAARQPPRSASASSSLDSSDMTPSTASSGTVPGSVPAGSAVLAGRARSASRSSYSTFPATGRTNTAYGHNNSNSSVNSVPRLQPVPTQPFAARRGGSGGRAVGQAGNINVNGHNLAGSLPTPPPTAVQPKEQQHYSQQQQRQPSLPRLAVATADGIPFNGQPSSQRSPMSRTPTQPLASPSALAPPPLSATGRQRQQRQPAGSGGVGPAADEIHEMDASTDAGDGSTAQNRSSYGSVGGSSITSSVLMSPGLLQWPVPPQTPPISVRDGGLPEDMMGQGQMLSYMVPGQQSAPVGHPVSANAVRRPLTTSSSGSTTIGRGSMPTRAPLNGPATRSLLQTPVGRRPSLVGGGGHGSAPSGYGHISQQQQQKQSYLPQTHQYSQQRPQQQNPQYQQQQYPQQQRAPMGYMPPQASALTVHTDGQATSVRIPISRYQSPQSPQGRRQDYY